MPLFPGAKDDDILSWRTVQGVVDALHERLDRERSNLLSGEELPILRQVKGQLDQERAFEAEFAQEFAKGLEGVDRQRDGLLPLWQELGSAAIRHFERRGSVIAFHELCHTARTHLVRRCLKLAEEWMVQQGFGAPRGRYCWFFVGSPGRRESTVWGGGENILVYEEGNQNSSYFSVFARKAEEVLLELGAHSRLAAALAHFPWHGTIGEWRDRLAHAVAGRRQQEELAALVGLVDLSLAYGDGFLAGEMLNLVRGMLSFHHDILRNVGRHVSEMPTGLDFFGRLRVDRGGGHRGAFNVEQYALDPLVSNVRVLAARSEVKSVNTAERVKELLERGALTVELAERLLLAFHDFSTYLIVLENQSSQKNPWLAAEQLGQAEEQVLKADLEAVGNLQRIVYQSVTENV